MDKDTIELLKRVMEVGSYRPANDQERELLVKLSAQRPKLVDEFWAGMYWVYHRSAYTIDLIREADPLYEPPRRV